MTQIELVAQISQAPPKTSPPYSSSSTNAALGFDATVICFTCLASAWGIMLWMLKKPKKNLLPWQSQSRQNSIPCYSCKFLNNNCYLKCAVNPSIALTEDAIECPDYCPTQKCNEWKR
jgi:hypothetical protein